MRFGSSIRCSTSPTTAGNNGFSRRKGGREEAPRLIVVQNFFEELRQRMGN